MGTSEAPFLQYVSSVLSHLRFVPPLDPHGLIFEARPIEAG